MSGTLSINLPGGTLHVDAPNWGSMSSADQQDFIQHVTSSVGPQADSSFSADLQSGAHGAMTAAGTAGQAIGSGLSDIGLPTAGGAVSSGGTWLKNNAPAAPANYQPRSANIMSDLRAGNYGQAAGDVGHAIAQGAAPAGAALAAGAAGSAIGLPSAAGAALVGGTLGLGEGAENSAAKAGRDTPNSTDLVHGLPEAGLGALTTGVGLGRAVPGGIVGRAAAGATANAANTAGTNYLEGKPNDPDQIANSAIVGGAGAAAAEAPGMVRSGVKAGVDRAMLTTMDAPSQNDALAQVGLKNDADATGIDNRTRAYNNTKANYKMELGDALNNVAQDALQSGANPQDVSSGVRRAKTIITDIAGRHNNQMTLQDQLSLQDALDWAAPAHVDTIVRGAQALNAGADQSIIKNQVGPFQKALGAAARYGGIGYELATGNPLAALAAVGLGHSPIGNMASRVGQGVGLGLDKMFGTATPVNDLRAMKAAQTLRDVGIDPNQVGSPMQDLRGLNSLFASPQRVTGAGPTPIPVNTPIRPGQPTPPQAPPAPTPQAPPPPAPPPAPAPQAPPQVPPAGAAARLQQAQALAGAKPPMPPQGGPQAPPPAQPATPTPAAQPMAPTASQGVPAWVRYVANGRPDVDPATAVQAAQAAETAGMVPAGTAASLAAHTGGYNKDHLQAIQQHLPPQPGVAPPGVAQAPGGRPWQYSHASVQDYHQHAIALGSQLRSVGLEDAANAVSDIAVNHHSQEAKAAARSALHPEVAKHVPDFLINHGPRKAHHVPRRP